MGLLDSVKNLLDKWNGKRKRSDEEEDVNSKVIFITLMYQ